MKTSIKKDIRNCPSCGIKLDVQGNEFSGIFPGKPLIFIYHPWTLLDDINLT